MSAEKPDDFPEGSAHGRRRRVRRRRSVSGGDFMHLSRERLTWRELFKTDRTFVGVVSMLLLAVVVGLLLLVPLWRASPDGFYPVYRLSGVGLLNERLAIRAAEAAEARGDLPRAMAEWRRAVDTNPAASRSKRRYLQSCVDQGMVPSDPEAVVHGIRQANLLLRLGGTNQADVELTAAFAHAVEQEDYVIRVLRRRPLSQLTPSGRATLAGACFQTDDFQAVLEVAAVSPAPTNGIFRVRRVAAAMVVAGAASADDWAGLDPRSGLGISRSASLRAQLVVAASLGDEPRFNEAWSQLERDQSLRARDHVRRWQLYSRLGRATDAANAALAFDLRPQTAHEAIQVVRGLDRIGMSAKAIRYGEAALEQHRGEPNLWREVGRLMVRGSPPEILIRFASNLRRVDWDDGPHIGLASFYVGVAEHRLGHPTRAEEAFGDAGTDPYLRLAPLLALECADTMRQMGYPEGAERIVQAVIADHGADPGFWTRVLRAAREARSESWVLDAARREHHDTPGQPHAQQGYLDALLLNRTNAVEALTLATRLHQAQPGDAFRTVALARALALQGQWAAVDRTLARLDDATLRRADADVVSRCHLARGEAWVELDRRREAAEVLSRVDTTRLFPDELARLQVLRERAR